LLEDWLSVAKSTQLNRNTPSRVQLGGVFCVRGVAFKSYDVMGSIYFTDATQLLSKSNWLNPLFESLSKCPIYSLFKSNNAKPPFECNTPNIMFSLLKLKIWIIMAFTFTIKAKILLSKSNMYKPLYELFSRGLIELFSRGLIELFSRGLIELFSRGLIELFSRGLMELFSRGLIELFNRGLIELFSRGLIELFSRGLIELFSRGLIELFNRGFLFEGNIIFVNLFVY
jgi:hypothetical protein